MLLSTYDENTALDWAMKNYPKGYVVNKYSIDFEKLNNGSLKIKRFEANEEWAKFVWSNRYDANFKRPNYDIIVGPIADRGLREKFMEMKTENKTFAEIAPSIQYDKYCSLQVCFCSYYAVSMLNIIE